MKYLPILLCLALFSAYAQKPDKPKKPKVYAATVNPQDTKNLPSGKPLPPEDPELAKYYFAENKLPLPAVTAAVETKLPLALKKGDHVVFIGNTLFDRGAQFPHFEAMLQKGRPRCLMTILDCS